MSNFVKVRKGYSSSSLPMVRITTNGTMFNAAARDELESKYVAIYLAEDTAEALVARTTPDDPDAYRLTATGVLNCNALREFARRSGKLGENITIVPHAEGVLITFK